MQEGLNNAAPIVNNHTLQASWCDVALSKHHLQNVLVQNALSTSARFSKPIFQFIENTGDTGASENFLQDQWPIILFKKSVSSEKR